MTTRPMSDPESSHSASRERWFYGVAVLSVLAGIVFVWMNRLRGLGYFDGSEYALHIRGGGIAHAPGYPLFILLGKAMQALGAGPFLAQQLLSLLSLAVAAFALYRTFALEVGPGRTGFAPALAVTLASLSAAYYLRLFAILPEVFLLNVALLALLIWAITAYFHRPLPRHLGLVFFVYGLGLCHHHTLALTLPGCLFLVIKQIRCLKWSVGLAVACGGLVLGCLPLAYLFVGSRGAEHTYYRVNDLTSLLFVLLRRGYGTFKLTSLAIGGDLPGLYQLALEGLVKNYNYVGLLLLVPLLWVGAARGQSSEPTTSSGRAYRWSSPSLVLAVSTCVVYLCVFVPNCNLELSTRTYRYVFLRFLTVPYFLSSYLVFRAALIAWDKTARWGFSRQATVAGAMVGLSGVGAVVTAPGLRYGNSDLLDEHIRLGYRAIFSQIAPSAVAASGGRHRCLVFAEGDTMLMGLRYYNEYVADQRCYLFGLTAFSGQFLHEPELALAEQTLKIPRARLVSGELAARPELLLNLFLTLDRQGYSVFVFSVTDYSGYFGKLFTDSPFAYRPVGNILQVITRATASWGMERMLSSYAGYVADLEKYVERLETHGVVSEVADSQANQALVLNLADYAKFGRYYPGPPGAVEKLLARAAAVRDRWARLVPPERVP